MIPNCATRICAWVIPRLSTSRIVIVGDAKDLEPALKQEGWRSEKVAFAQPVTAPAALPEAPADRVTAVLASTSTPLDAELSDLLRDGRRGLDAVLATGGLRRAD